MNPELLAFAKHHYVFLFFVVIVGWYMLVVLTIGMKRLGYSSKTLELAEERLKLVAQIARLSKNPATDRNLSTALSTLTTDDWEKVKDLGLNVLLPLIPKSLLQNNAEKRELISQAQVHTKAAAAGLDKESYIPVRQKEAMSKVELEHARQSTTDAIEAGIELNSVVHKRRRQINNEIQDWEQDLASARTLQAKERIQRTIDDLKAEYDGLKRDTV
jgi:hypothetical protein